MTELMLLGPTLMSKVDKRKRIASIFLCPVCGWHTIKQRSSGLVADTCSSKCSWTTTPKRTRKSYNGMSTDGQYIIKYVPNHPRARAEGYVPLHRIVMEESIGRYLNSDEIVHHIDENKLNNNLSNLRVMTDFDHKSLHNKGRKKCKNSV